MLELIQKTARDDLLGYCVYTDKYFEIHKHHEIMATKLQQFMEWKIKRLILQTPPRSWKSRMVCEAISHWMWKLNNTDIIYTWHTISLLEWFSKNIRDRVNSDEYKELFDARIKSWSSWVTSRWMDNWNQLMIYWVGWAITGKWWHRLIIDDPYATRQDAESETVRARVIEWYKSTFYSRRQNQDAWICLIMQRWREDDLVWELLLQDDWEVIKIPAINDKWESFRPSRFSVAELENMRKQIWDYFFMSQYQQDPLNEWGWDFRKEYFEYYEDVENIKKRLNIITFLDPAISEKQEADNTAIVTVWIDYQNNFVYLLEVKKLKTNPDEIINELFITAQKYRDYWNNYKAWIEVVQYQKMLALEIKKQMRLRDYFFYLEEVNPQGEKAARIRTVLQPRYSNHSIIHPKYWQNIQDLELELLKFPNGKHDDMIDALASALALSEVNTYVKQNIITPNYI